MDDLRRGSDGKAVAESLTEGSGWGLARSVGCPEDECWMLSGRMLVAGLTGLGGGGIALSRSLETESGAGVVERSRSSL